MDEHMGEQPVDERVAAVLSRLGYRYRANGATPFILPPLCLVPAGTFMMGSDRQRDAEAWPLELPQHLVETATFEIATYPVTVAEYACAVDAGAVRVPPSDRGEPWGAWAAQREVPEHPAVMLSWFDAVTYAHWLSDNTGETWRLPTEAEWEKAARGTDARIYPWGSDFDSQLANTAEAGLGRLTGVDTYPDGASPYGVIDLIGNVMEWCSSAWMPYPYDSNDGREQLVSDAAYRIARGGSYIDSANNARAATRWPLEPNRRKGPFGMRLVRDPS